MKKIPTVMFLREMLKNARHLGTSLITNCQVKPVDDYFRVTLYVMDGDCRTARMTFNAIDDPSYALKRLNSIEQAIRDLQPVNVHVWEEEPL